MIKRARAKFDSLLTEYSPRFGLDLNYFVKGGFWLGLGQATDILKAFLASVLLANMFTKEIYGQYNFIIVMVSLAGIFALPGMNNAIIDSVAKGYDGTFKKILKSSFFWSLLGSLGFIILSIYGLFNERFYGFIIFLIISLIFPFYEVSRKYYHFLIGRKLFDVYVWYKFIFNLTYVLALGLMFLLKFNLVFLITLIFLIQTIMQIIFTLIILNKYVKNNLESKKSLDFGKKLNFSFMFSQIISYIDSLLVAYFLGFIDLAIFSIITLIPNQLKNVVSSMTPMILPKFIDSPKINQKDILKSLIKLFFIFCIPVLIYFVIAPPLFQYFYPKYYEYVNLSMFFNISFLTIIYFLPMNFFLKQHHTKKIAHINVISGTILIISSIVLINFFGLIGAIIGRIIYRSSLLILSLIYLYLE